MYIQNNKNMKGTIKSQILQALHSRHGNGRFRYTDIVKEVLVQRGIISDHSLYDWRVHRGYYACAINRYNSNYMYVCTQKNPWRLERVWVQGNQLEYRVIDCRGEI